jgi:type VII secretion-associated protein (TIGR03931 family)
VASPHRNLGVAVDVGTSSTVTAVDFAGPPRLVLFDGAPLLASGVFGAADGSLFVGADAQRQAAVDPSRYEPYPGRHLDEGEFLLGDTVFSAVSVVRAVLGRAVGEARRSAGGAPIGRLVLTHPVNWAATRLGVLRAAAAGLAEEIVTMAEPVAAAVFHGAEHPIPVGCALAVLDLGAGTVDCAVLRRSGTGFEVLASAGDPTFGGADVDQAILDHLAVTEGVAHPDAWRDLTAGTGPTHRGMRRMLREDVRRAKEALSRHLRTEVVLPAPFRDSGLTRQDLEHLIAEPIRRTAVLLRDTIRTAGLVPERLSGIFLVGGSSRIPLVSRVVHEVTGLVPIVSGGPETVVALGALVAASASSDLGATTWIPSVAVVPTGRRPPPGRARRLPAGRWRGRRALLGAIGLTIVLVVCVGLWSFLPSLPPTDRETTRFGHRFSVPAGWQRTGGDEALRQTVIRPDDAVTGSNQLVVQEFPLAFDVAVEPARATEELRSLVRGAGYADFTEHVLFGGREFAHYREQRRTVVVDWYVLFRGRTQVSVGCGYLTDAMDRVRTACESLARTVVVTG